MTKEQFIYALTACGCLLKDGKTWYEHNELIKCFEDLGLFEQEPVLDKIRTELHATAEMHDDGDYYLREKWIGEIFDSARRRYEICK